jgi:hypothetical protein
MLPAENLVYLASQMYEGRAQEFDFVWLFHGNNWQTYLIFIQSKLYGGRNDQ